MAAAVSSPLALSLLAGHDDQVRLEARALRSAPPPAWRMADHSADLLRRPPRWRAADLVERRASSTGLVAREALDDARRSSPATYDGELLGERAVAGASRDPLAGLPPWPRPARPTCPCRVGRVEHEDVADRTWWSGSGPPTPVGVEPLRRSARSGRRRRCRWTEERGRCWPRGRGCRPRGPAAAVDVGSTGPTPAGATGEHGRGHRDRGERTRACSGRDLIVRRPPCGRSPPAGRPLDRGGCRGRRASRRTSGARRWP